jgi:acyl-CoA thioesterase FadM
LCSGLAATGKEVARNTALPGTRTQRWPGTVEIGTAVEEIGRSSYRFLQAVFHAGALAASGRTTMVLIDSETRRARPLPPELIGRLQQLRIAS